MEHAVCLNTWQYKYKEGCFFAHHVLGARLFCMKTRFCIHYIIYQYSTLTVFCVLFCRQKAWANSVTLYVILSTNVDPWVTTCIYCINTARLCYMPCFQIWTYCVFVYTQHLSFEWGAVHLWIVYWCYGEERRHACKGCVAWAPHSRQVGREWGTTMYFSMVRTLMRANQPLLSASGQNLRAAGMMPGPGGEASTPGGREEGPGATTPKVMPKEPEIMTVTFNKVKGSLGLSIVAAKVSVARSMSLNAGQGL